MALPAALAQDQNWEFFTQAGNGTAVETNGAGTEARFNKPFAVALDNQGNMIVADAAGQTIRRVSFSDGVTTLAGPTGFGKPAGVAVDSGGRIYVADSMNHTIDVVNGDGSVSVIAGTSGTPGSADGSGTSAQFNGPTGLALDGNGNLYVADTGNSTIRQLALNNSPVRVTTIAGIVGVAGSVNGTTGTTSSFSHPQGVAFFYNGQPTLYVADTGNNTIRVISLNSNQVGLLAGAPGSPGHVDGTEQNAKFSTPTSIASDGNWNLFITDSGSNVIRKIDGYGNVTTLGGVAGTPGNADGIGTAALFTTPHGIAADTSGNVYVADTGNNEIRIGFSEDNVGLPLFAVFEQINLDQTSASTPTLDPDQPYQATAQSPVPGTVVATPASTHMGSLSLPFNPSNVDFEVDDTNFPNGLPDLEALDGTYTFTAPDQSPDSVAITGDLFPTTGPSYPTGQPPGIASATNAEWVPGEGGVLVVVDPTKDATLTLAAYPGWGALAAPAFDHMQVELRGQNDNVRLDQEAFSTSAMGATASDPIASFTIPAKTLTAGNLYDGQIQCNKIVSLNNAGLAGYNVQTSFTVAAMGPAPTIPGGEEPQSTSVYPGQQASFSVGNSGGSNLTYQWSESTDGGNTWANLSNNSVFSGSQTQNLQISSVTSAMSGAEFLVRVSNLFGTTPSTPATLTVLTLAPIVVLQSPSETVLAGQAASFSAGSTGAGPLSYQWQESTNQGGAWTSLTDGNGIAGSQTGTLTVGSARPSMSGYEFQLVVKNSSGTATSAPVTLTVTPVPSGDGVGFDFTTPAGLPPGSADGTGSAARFRSPNATATDTAHNIYVADSGNDTIRMITPAGVVTTLAGSAGVAGSADGQGTAARFNNPTGIAVDGAGNLYVADGNNYTVRRITPATAGGVTTWTVTTLAGQAGRGGTNNGTGSTAQFNYLGGLAVDGGANVYVADSNNNAIRKITPGGVVTTYAGIPGSSGSANGAASSAQFSNPSGVALDGAGDLYVADTNNSTIRMITQGGVVSTLAGQVRNYSFSDGTGTAALFNQPGGVAVDAGGNVYVADSGNNAIRVIAAGGVVTTVEGNANRSGSTDGTGSAALFYAPTGLSVDASGILYVADNGNSTIRKIVISGEAVTTLAGVASAGSADGAGSSARLNAPHGLAVDSAGNVYVADSDNGTIRRITSGGSVSTLAGQAGDFGASDGTGSGAQFAAPIGVAVDVSGNVYVADQQADTIRKVTPGGAVTTVAGSAWNSAWLDGTGTAARFATPHGLAVDKAGNLYVVDEGDDTIREITPGGTVTTIAGQAFTPGNANGAGSSARFSYPTAVAVDGQGDLYIADDGNSTVRKITPNTVSGVTTWAVTTLAGSPGRQGSANGIGTEAQFNGPDYLTVDGAGNVYVTEPPSDTIRRITPAGVVTTVGGSAWNMGTMNGLGALAEFDFPTGIAIDGSGNLYVSDTGNNTVRMGTPTPEALPAISVQPMSAAIAPGGNASFTVTANSNTSLSYGWLVSTDGGNSWTSVSDGNGISGSATSSIAVDGVPAAYSGVELEAVVSNEAGTVTTSPATLTVSSNPLIELQSGSETVLAGQGASFSVGITSSSATSYQWQDSTNGGGSWTPLSDGAGISGSATTTLSLSATAAGSLGGYEFQLVATNLSGSVTSAPMTLTVSPMPPGAAVGFNFSTIAGQSGVGSTDSPNGPGSAARFNNPNGAAVDAAGNVYVADSNNDVIRKVSPAGNVTTLAGADGNAGFSNGQGSAAQFRNPSGLALDAEGNLYVADSGNNAVRKIAPSGAVSTLAGGGGSGSLNGAGSAAQFNFPRAVAVDSSGAVYVSDSGNSEIRKIDTSGNVTTLAGSSQRGSSDGQGTAAQFGNPVGVAVDASGNVYVADSNYATIREISPSGAVTTFAGQAGHYGYQNGTGTAANFSNPQGLAIDGSGNLYVTDSNNQTVRTITPAGVVTLLAGSVYRSGAMDGPAGTAQFNSPIGVAVDASGNVYVADSGSDTVRKVTVASAMVSTLAGQAGIGSVDSPGGPGSAARFFSPQGTAVDSAGNVYVADSSNGTIRRINQAGDVTTLAGFAGQFGNADGAGSSARFNSPQGVAVDVRGNVYLTDSGNNSIRMITPSGSVSTLAGGAGFGNSDGTGSAARFNSPQGVAVDLPGNVYVADTSNSSIRMITPSGAVSTLAGGVGSGWTDGVGSAATFWFPRGISVDGAGNLYIADSNNAVIRKITPTVAAGVTTWTVFTLAGNPSFRSSVDGTGTAAHFSYPSGLAIDTAGNLYVTDGSNDVIRKVTPAGVVTTVGGMSGQSGSTDGFGSAARFDQPYGIAVDGEGNLYVADTDGQTIREGALTAVSPPSINGQPENTAVTAGGTASFSATATSLTSVSFQWQESTDGGNTWNSLQDGGGISGSETANLSVSNVPAADSGYEFEAIVSNPAGSVTSAAATLTVESEPDITAQAGDAYRAPGESAVFTVNATGTPQATYQWQESTDGGNTWTTVTDSAAFSGATTSSLQVNNVTAAMSGEQFRAVVKNSLGTVIGQAATLTTVGPAYDFTTIAGVGPGDADGMGSAARFDNPGGVAADSEGNLYVSDSYNCTIRKITPAGLVTTFAGSPGNYGSADGIGSAAQFNYPGGLTVDSSGNVYVADSGNNTIRKITPAGVVTTVAGSAGNTGSADGAGSAAQFSYPQDVAVDGAGNVYVADTYNYTIRKIDASGNVTTFAGSAGSFGNSDGTGSAAQFSPLGGVAVDGAGDVYVADTGSSTIRMITPDGVVKTIAGEAWSPGYADGTGTNAQFCGPTSVAADDAGNIYVSDAGNDVIRAITVSGGIGTVTTLAGSFGNSGSADGVSGSAQFYGNYNMRGLATDALGDLFVADTGNDTIRKISVSPQGVGTVSTIAGLADSGSADGTGEAAKFNGPVGVAVDGSGNVFVADTNNSTIREIVISQGAGTVTTLAGSPRNFGSADGVGSAAVFNGPEGVAVDGSDNVYVADTYNDTIRKITPDGVVTTLAGSPGNSGSADGAGSAAQFSNPEGVAVDGAGNVYVADTNNSAIRKITPAGLVTTLAGSSDGQGSAAQFNRPEGVAVDGSGNVYVADPGVPAIWEITPAGVVTTLAGSSGNYGSADGVGTAAQFSNPQSVAIDPSGGLLVMDNGLIRLVTVSNGVGTVSTIAGGFALVEGSDGVGGAASLSQGGIAVDGSGNIYVANTEFNTVSVGSPEPAPAIAKDPQSETVTAPQSASFTVAANGPELSYQWQVEAVGSSTWTNLTDGGPISGSTTATLTVNPTDASLSGEQFQVVVGNDAGSVTSAAATLTVESEPDITAQAGDAYRAPGESAVFTVNATGTPQATYQWQESTDGGNTWTTVTDSAAFSGATTSSLQVNNVTAAMSGEQFRAVVKNNVGTVTSQAATLTTVGPAYDFTTLAGLPPGDADGTGSAARFYNPLGIAADKLGNLYVTDSGNSTIRKITPAGLVTTFAGEPGEPGSADGTGSAARFNVPWGLAVDGAGNVYVVDSGNDTIREITPAGVVTTLAGSAGNFGRVDGSGSAARFNGPTGLAIDGQGSLFVMDSGNGEVRKIDASGEVTTMAGGSWGSADGTGSAAQFGWADGIAVDSAGNVYVADTTSATLRKITPGRVVTTIAGQPGSSGFANGTGSSARFNGPSALAVDGAGDIYVSDSGSAMLRKVTVAAGVGTVTTVAGSPGSPGSADGTGSAAQFNNPIGMALDASGALLVADSGNDTIRSITVSPEGVGTVSTLAGLAGLASPGSANGAGTVARFNHPSGAAVDGSGNIYVADTKNDAIRQIHLSPTGEVAVTTLAGTPGVSGATDSAAGPPLFNQPEAVAVDGAGNVYVADTGNDTVRKITVSAGVATVTTLAGSPGNSGDVNGTGSAARFNNPSGLAVDGAGNVYVADSGSDAIRKITPSGAVTTLAGGSWGSANGIGGAAQFSYPTGVAVDGAGNVFATDLVNSDLREISPTGAVTTIAGNPNQPGSADGIGGAAQFSSPWGLALGPNGGLYVMDNNLVRLVTVSKGVGTVYTIAGGFAAGMGSEGVGGAASLSEGGIAVDAAGNLYVANSGFNTVSVGRPRTVPSITTNPLPETVAAPQRAAFTVAASGSGLSYQWQVEAPGSSTWTNLTDGGAISGSTTATLTVNPTDVSRSGEQFQVVVANGSGSVASNPAMLTVNKPVSTVTLGALNQFYTGSPLAVTVAANPVVQAIFVTYNGSATAPTAAGSYAVVATVYDPNYTGSATGTFIITGLPTIETQAASQTVTAGNNATFTVAANGTSYQWQVSANRGVAWVNLSDGNGISGSTTATLTISGAAASLDGYEYQSIVTNGAGSVTTTPATLTVTVPPSIATQPASQVAVLGGSATFTVAAGGTSPFTYQWNFNGSPIQGATSSSYTIRLAQNADAGNYTVKVTNSDGSVTSNGAALTVNPTLPSITSPATAGGIQGATFSYLATTSSAVATFSITSGTLPAGLTLNGKSGAITGTPTASGTSTVTLTATNVTGSESTTLAITINPPAPMVTSAIAAKGQVGASFTYSIQASNSPTTFGATGLPAGLTVSTAGVISGTPTQAGTFTVTLSAGNSTGTTTQTLQLSIAPAANAPVYTGPTQVSGKENAAFSFTPNFGVGVTGYAFVNVSTTTPSTLPGGLTLDPSAGTISGTPTQTGTFLVAVQATNAGGSTTQALTITINAPPAAPAITSASTASATVGTAFTFTVTSTPSASSYSATGLPPGLTLSSTGAIGGTPTSSGTYNVRITPTLNGVGSGAASVLQISVSPALASPVITSSPSAIGQVGGGFFLQVTASGSPTGFAVTSGTLPAGLNLNTTSGAITGTPTQAGTSEAWIAASNSSGQGLALGVTFTIGAAPATPTITSNSTAAGQVGQPFSYVIAASNGPTGYSETGLPSGLTLNTSTGIISGIPAAATFQPVSVELTAVNANGSGTVFALSMTIASAPATPVITSANAASGEVGAAFTYQMTASNSPTSYAAQDLPAGLDADPASGTITGTPTQAGTFEVSLSAANVGGLGATTTLVVTIAAAPAAPVITSSASDSAKVGMAYSYTIEAAPGPIASYNVTGSLPLGLELDTSEGVISGTPAESGVFTVYLTATSSAGTSQPEPFELVVAPAEGVPAITSSLSENATVGAAFSYAIMATNVPSTTPFPPSVTLDAVDLPPGLSVNPSTGVIAGTPTLQGTYTVGLQGVNAAGSGSIAYLTISVGAAPTAPVVNSAAMAQAQVGQPFAYAIAATNNPTSYQVLNAPSWMTVNSATGILGGTPASPGNVSVQLEAINEAGTSQPLTLSIAVSAVMGTPVITSGRSQTGDVGTALTYQITATNSPTSFVATGLPAGLSFDSTTGTITGTPTSSGTFAVALTASNSGGDSNPVTLTLTINATDSINL